jgi:cytochrome P450
MGKPLSEAPVVSLNPQELITYEARALLAQQVQRDGALLRWTIPSGQRAGHEGVLLIGPEANRFVMHTHREYLSNELGWNPSIGKMIGKGLLNMDPPEHTVHRKMWNPAFTGSHIESYLPSIQRVLAEHTSSWLERGEVDLYDETRSATFQVVASTLAGLTRGAEVDRAQRLFFTVMGAANPDPRGYQERVALALQARAELNRLLLELIAERRETLAHAAHDVLGMTVHARDEAGHSLSDEQMLGHFSTLLVAGHESTSMLSAFVLYMLATQPEQRRRVEEELDALVDDSSGLLSVEATRQMRVLDNFVKETSRLRSPMFTVPRQVIREVDFAGFTLPEGTTIHLGLAAGHYLETVFENPQAFDPDRFNPPRSEEKRTPYGLVPFSGGPRLCIGINFATIEVKLLAALVSSGAHRGPASPADWLDWHNHSQRHSRTGDCGPAQQQAYCKPCLS